MPSPQAGIAGEGVEIPELVAPAPPFDPYPVLFGVVTSLQNVAVIISLHVVSALVPLLFELPALPELLPALLELPVLPIILVADEFVVVWAATGDVANRAATMSASFITETSVAMWCRPPSRPVIPLGKSRSRRQRTHEKYTSGTSQSLAIMKPAKRIASPKKMIPIGGKYLARHKFQCAGCRS
jgi:hypothetical protein